jgi:hypothetical protein
LRESSKTFPQAPSDDPVTQLRQLRVLKSAYDACTPREPQLPSPESPLPSLLALRTLHRTIQESKAALASSQIDLSKAEQRLEKGQSDLNDANLITQHLEARIGTLQLEIQERTQKTPTQVAQEIKRDTKKKDTLYNKRMRSTIRDFNAFVDTHLASMLAAEELGGPVVGDMIDVDELALESGFNSKGGLKKQKGPKNADKRQKRIDQIWGQRPDAEKDDEPWDETRAAAKEMRELTEELLNSLVGGEGDGYVELKSESAASRYLVRSNVAQLHPRDARKLRLVDFGRDLDD